MECTLYLTDNCNLRCSYCYEGIEKTEQSLQERDLPAVLEFLARYRNDGEQVHLLFLGGEPLLCKDLIYETIQLLESKYQELTPWLTYEITTNGILLDDKIIDLFWDNKFIVSISVDGDRDTHLLNRKSTGTAEVYEKIIDNLKKLCDKGINTSIRMTVTANNAHMVCKNIRYFYGFGVNKIHIGLDYLSDWTKEQMEAFDLQLGQLDEYYLDYIIEDDDRILNLYDYKLPIFVFDRKVEFCSAGSQGHFVINTKGELYPCGYVNNQEEWKIGSVFTEINRKKLFHMIRKNIKKTQECQNCSIASVCIGTKCGFLNYAANGYLNKPHERICLIEKMIYKHNRKVIVTLYQRKQRRLVTLLEKVQSSGNGLGRIMKEIVDGLEGRAEESCTH